MLLNHVFVLAGAANTGKTTTLNRVIKLLEEKGAKKTSLPSVGNDPRDVIAVLEVDGRIIGVSTCGDFEQEVKDGIQKLKDEHCDVFIVAARSYGGTHDAITRHFPEPEAIAWLLKYGQPQSEPKQQACNESTAQMMSLLALHACNASR